MFLSTKKSRGSAVPFCLGSRFLQKRCNSRNLVWNYLTAHSCSTTLHETSSTLQLYESVQPVSVAEIKNALIVLKKKHKLFKTLDLFLKVFYEVLVSNNSCSPKLLAATVVQQATMSNCDLFI